MKLVALTGGIGSGKSTVSELFSKKNVPIIDTDVIAHDIILKNGPAYTRVVNHFGESILGQNKEIDRSILRKRIFSSPEERRQLEAILHPLIWEQVKARLKKIHSPYVIVVVPLLHESNQDHIKFDRILLVDVPVEMQIKRTSKRDNISEDEARKIIDTQVSREVRLKHADDILQNDNISQLTSQVDVLHNKYMKMSHE